MTATLLVQRAGPVATIQDGGRFGLLRYGISASGPMDRAGFAAAAAMLAVSGSAGVEFTQEPVDRYGAIDATFRDPSGNGWKMIEARRA